MFFDEGRFFRILLGGMGVTQFIGVGRVASIRPQYLNAPPMFFDKKRRVRFNHYRQNGYDVY